MMPLTKNSSGPPTASDVEPAVEAVWGKAQKPNSAAPAMLYARREDRPR